MRFSVLANTRSMYRYLQIALHEPVVEESTQFEEEGARWNDDCGAELNGHVGARLKTLREQVRVLENARKRGVYIVLKEVKEEVTRLEDGGDVDKKVEGDSEVEGVAGSEDGRNKGDQKVEDEEGAELESDSTLSSVDSILYDGAFEEDK